MVGTAEPELEEEAGAGRMVDGEDVAEGGWSGLLDLSREGVPFGTALVTILGSWGLAIGQFALEGQRGRREERDTKALSCVVVWDERAGKVE